MRTLNKKQIEIIKKLFYKTPTLINDILKYVEKYGSKNNDLKRDIEFARYVLSVKYK